MKVRSFGEIAEALGDRRGWRPGAGDVVLAHPSLGRVVHVGICKDDGSPMYDQFLHLEPVGAITVPVNSKGELGLVEVERPGVREAADYTFPNLDLTKFGHPSLEFPRGFPKKGEIAQQTAAREAGEELGSPIRDVRFIGELTPNTTFHSHRIPILLAIVDEGFAGAPPPDVNEKILKVRWHALDAVFACIRLGQIHCGMTKAALLHYLVVERKV